MVPLLTLHDITHACGRTYTQRGQAYQRSGKVLHIHWDNDRILSSSVTGRYKSNYSQTIEIYKGSKPLEIDGDCSCPVGFNCKHVAAALLEWLESRPAHNRPDKKMPVSSLAQWQQLVIQSQDTRKESFASGSQERLLYLLHATENQGKTQISLSIIKCRQLQRGGWSKPVKLSIDRLAHAYYDQPRYLSNLDDKIINHLRRQIQSNRINPILGGDDGGLLLRRLLDSGRCYLENPNTPALQWGASLALHCLWKEELGHKLQITLPPLTNEWLCIPTNPPFYIEPSSSTCGTIDAPFNGEELALLQQLPVVPTTELQDVSRFLHKQFQSLPLPMDLNIQEHQGPPIPIITLAGFSHTNGYNHLASLQFSYGECRLPPAIIDPSETVNVNTDNTEWLIQRDAEGELAYVKQLSKLGLTPVSEENQFTSHSLEWIFSGASRMNSAAKWQHFLHTDIPKLQTEGWRIEWDDSFLIQFQSTTDFTGSLADNGDWFALGLDIQVGKKRVPLLPLIIDWLEHNDPHADAPILVETTGHQWLEIPRDVVTPIIRTLVELHDQPSLNEDGQLNLPRQQAPRLLTLEQELHQDQSPFSWRGSKKIRTLANKLKHFTGIKPIKPPKGLKAELRTYQQQGLEWLHFLTQYEFNGILADDMGLGKTLQTLAHLLRLKETRKLTKPVLIIAPTSLLSNWKREAEHFTPRLTVSISHGPKRDIVLNELEQFDIIVTSYALLARDFDVLNQHSFHSLILDEAQMIKNPQTKVAICARQLNTQNRLCLSGTPLENHLGELWSLFHFLMPDFLGQQKRFNQLFRYPIEKHGNHLRQQELNQRIQPFMLRRTKQQVAGELPPKTEITRSVQLGPQQQKLYETIRVAMKKRVRQLLMQKGLAHSHIEVLDALLKLRQVCCDPQLLKLPSAKKVKQSAKLELLLEMLTELLDEGRKILIFSQFTSMLNIIEIAIKRSGIQYSKLTGQTRKRDEAIDLFKMATPLFF